MDRKIFKTLDKFRKVPLIIKTALLIFAVLSLYTGIQGYRAATRVLAELNDQYRSNDSLMVRMVQSDPLFDRIMTEKWLQTQLRLSALDSIILYINLRDSSISLVLKGVTVFDQPLESFGYSKILNKMDRSAKVSLLSNPLMVTADTASIPKANYRTVKAPKNEEEASLLTTQILPDTIREEVAARLLLENGMTILLEQGQQKISHDSRSYRKFLSDQRTRTWLFLCKDLLSLKIPDYHPWIKIYLPGEEVKNIYRALPGNAMVVLMI
jgi:hypothetical protein